MPERLTEHVADWRAAGVVVDGEHRLVRNVALTGLRSRNGYAYREAALREALPLYADKPVFLDHAPAGERPFERSTRDLVGSIVGPRFEAGRVRADVRVLDTEAGRTFLALAEANGPAVGMSHVVLAERSLDGRHVERLHDVVCVDAVVFPATTTSLAESSRVATRHGRGESQNNREGAGSEATGPQVDAPTQRSDVPRATPTGLRGSPATVAASAEAIQEAIDDALPTWLTERNVTGISAKRIALLPDRVLVDLRTEHDTRRLAIAWSLTGEAVTLGEQLDGEPTTTFATLRDDLATLVRERDELATRLERLETERRLADESRSVDRLLAESGLPAFATDDTFRRRLLDVPADRRRELIAERRSLIDACRVRGPVSPERRADDRDALAERLVRAIRAA